MNRRLFLLSTAGLAAAPDPQPAPRPVGDVAAPLKAATAGMSDWLASVRVKAIAAGVFGVPAFEVDGKVFWGLDALPMLRSYLDGAAWFQGETWDAVHALPSGLTRA